MSCHFILTRATEIKKMLVRMQRSWSPGALLVGMQNGAAAVETVWRFLEKLNRELQCDPAILLLVTYTEELRQIFKQNLYVNVHSSSVLKSQKVEIAQMSICR